MIQQYLCSEPGHQNQEVLHCCLEVDCIKQSPCCPLCILKYHSNHMQSCLEFYQIVESIETGLINPFEQDFTSTLDRNRTLLLKWTSEIRQAIKKQVTADQQLGVIAQKGKAIKQLLTQYFSGLQKINSIISSSYSIFEIFSTQLQAQISNIKHGEQSQYRLNIDAQLKNINSMISQVQEIASKPISYSLAKEEQNQVQQQAQQTEQYQVQQDILLQKLKIIEQDNGIENLPGYYKYIETLTKCQQQNISFEDPEFPPNDDSSDFDGTIWARLRQYCGKEIKFFYKKEPNIFGSTNEVQLGDIMTGIVGNEKLLQICYVIANHCPDQLKKVFVTQDICANNIYALRLCKKSIEQIVFVDDYIPIHPEFEILMTIIGSNSSIWISVLEKGLAKLIGNYHLLHCFSPFLLFETILQSPAIQYFSKENLIVNLNQEIDLNSLLITFFQEDELGICQIVKLCKVTHQNFKEIDLIQLKMTKKIQWKGKWDDQSPMWNQIQEKQDYRQKGAIFMDQFEFSERFPVFYSYRLSNTQVINQISTSSRKNQAIYFKIVINNSWDYLVTIRPVNEVPLRTKILLTIVRSDVKNSYTYIDSFVDPALGFANVINLKKGTYIGYAKIFWNNQNIEDATITVNGPSKVELIEIQKIPNLLYQPLLQLAFEMGQKSDFSNFEGFFLDMRAKGWIIMCIRNMNSKAVCVKQEFGETVNVKLMKPHTINHAVLQIQPNKMEGLIFKADPQSLISLGQAYLLQ